MNVQPPQLDLSVLRACSGIRQPLPMAVRAAQGLPALGSDELCKAVDEAGAVSFTGLRRKTITALPFSLHGERNMELVIQADSLEGGGPIRLVDCTGIRIRATGVLRPTGVEKFFLDINRCSHFTLDNLRTVGGRHTLLVSDSHSFSLDGVNSRKGEGYGIILHNCHHFILENCLVEKNLAGIMIVGQSHTGQIRHCTARDLRGFCNCDAGVHLCATSTHVTGSDIPEKCHEALSIEKKTRRPGGMVIEKSTFAHCRAQGIYLEGAVNCLIRDNIIVGNNKEGICFDWGSCNSLFVNNLVTLNGERRALSAEEIRIDFIEKYPLLADGSSSMKLPGISMDNGCMNLIDSNRIISNYGGGIKMIRASFLNRISNNLLLSNALGNNGYLPGFHGISALGVGMGQNEFSGDKNSLLDFLPSVANSICDNTIKEQCHALFFARGANGNFAENNLIEPNPACIYTLPGLRQRITARVRRVYRRLFPGNLVKQ